MCMFCAAAPAVLSVGVMAEGKQREKQIGVAKRNERAVKPALPVDLLTAAALTLIVSAAVLYHIYPGG
jgi:hypothetical protein